MKSAARDGDSTPCGYAALTAWPAASVPGCPMLMPTTLGDPTDTGAAATRFPAGSQPSYGDRAAGRVTVEATKQ
jgi:hypothetical protein